MNTSLTLSLLQTSLFWEDKIANLQMLEDRIRNIHERTEVIILPEMFSTGFSMSPAKLAEPMNGTTVGWMRDMAAAKRAILTGSLIIEDNGSYYNRLIWMLPTGELGYYDKRHLFGYAGEDQHYAQGHKRLIASANGWRINLQVCYDLRFPVWARQNQQSAGEAEYDLLIYVANWPEKRNHAWKTLLTARAIENQTFVVGVNRVGEDGNGIYHSGDSMVIDAMGGILYHKAHDEETFTITLDKQKLTETRQKLPFLKDADGFSIED
jgi:omega-amidase